MKAERHVGSSVSRFDLARRIRLERGKRLGRGRIGQGNRAGRFSYGPAQIDRDLDGVLPDTLLGSKSRRPGENGPATACAKQIDLDAEAPALRLDAPDDERALPSGACLVNDRSAERRQPVLGSHVQGRLQAVATDHVHVRRP